MLPRCIRRCGVSAATSALRTRRGVGAAGRALAAQPVRLATSPRGGPHAAGARALVGQARAAEPTGCVTLTRDRLEAFVQAELRFFAENKDKPLQPLRLREILASSRSPEEVATLLYQDLPVRFARRVRLIERVPGWESIPEISALRKILVKSFREVRLADPEEDPVAFARTIGRIRQRHKRIGALFAAGLQKMGVPGEGAGLGAPPRFDSRALEEWCEAFLSSRVSTEMMMAHYAACLGASHRSAGTKIGILDQQCDLFEICQQAIAQIEDGPDPCLIDAENMCEDIRVCQAPRYLYYIMMELLHNSAKATIDAAGLSQEELEARPIRVSVCANDVEIVIRVSDRGGGMPQSVAEQVWSYAFRAGRGGTVHVEEAGADSDDEPEEDSVSIAAPEELQDRALPWGVFVGDFTRGPISGPGLGLPMSRLYAKYLGGSLEVVNLPGLGVDAYLRLKRCESLTAAAEASVP